MRILGLMSGTSLDAIDVALGEFTPRGDDLVLTPVGSGEVPWAADLRAELLATHAPARLAVADWCRLHSAVGRAFGEAAAWALERFGPADLVVSHGQTLHHLVERGVVTGTLQVGDPAAIHARTGLPVLSDVRAADVAAGGQGAPLVPAFHAAAFGGVVHRVVVNIGGIANVTDLPPGGTVRGFDTGPGNVLSDLWHERHRGGAFDADGAWAASGRVDAGLLAALLCEPFLALAPPKSTGRDLFNAGWLEARLAGCRAAAVDVQATLLELAGQSIAQAIDAHCAGATEVLVCGGGARNAALLARLSALLAPRTVRTTDTAGIPSGQVEALAFAWLARETLAGRPGNLPAVTGAAGPRVLGAVYPA